MSTIILLDAGPLGMITNPKASRRTHEASSWFRSLVSNGVEVKIPEIADYEVRRELLRAGRFEGIKRLDELQKLIDYVPLTTDTMLEAARLWAYIRNLHLPTAPDNALDGDVILAAQAKVIERGGYEVIIATTNLKHLSRVAVAKEWKDIQFTKKL